MLMPSFVRHLCNGWMLALAQCRLSAVTHPVNCNVKPYLLDLSACTSFPFSTLTLFFGWRLPVKIRCQLLAKVLFQNVWVKTTKRAQIDADSYLLRPNGWMDPDATWYGGRPRPRPHCVRWGPSSTRQRAQPPPNFWPMSVVAKWLDGSRCHLVQRWPRPRPHCVRWGLAPFPPKRG